MQGDTVSDFQCSVDGTDVENITTSNLSVLYCELHPLQRTREQQRRCVVTQVFLSGRKIHKKLHSYTFSQVIFKQFSRTFKDYLQTLR